MRRLKMSKGAKILTLDIETMAALAWTWQLYDVNIGIDMIERDEYMLCWCAKWLGEKRILSDSILNYKTEFKKDPTSDRLIAKSLHKVMDEADIIVTHNGNRFDLKWANELFLKHGLGPVSSYHSVDTFSASKANFRSLSYKLQFRLQKLKIGEKLKHEGFSMWKKFAAGKRTKMVAYCKQDVKKTEELYLEIRPFIKNHPNLALYNSTVEFSCPNCSSKKLVKYGVATTRTNRFQRYQCKDCGRETRGKRSLLTKEERTTLSGT